MEASESNRTTHTSPLEDQGISMQDIPYFSIVERLAHTNPVGQLPGPLSYKLLDQFTMPMPCPAAMIMLPQWKLLKTGFWSCPPSLILP